MNKAIDDKTEREINAGSNQLNRTEKPVKSRPSEARNQDGVDKQARKDDLVGKDVGAQS